MLLFWDDDIVFLYLGGYGGEKRDEYQESGHHKHHVRLVFKNLQRGITASQIDTVPNMHQIYCYRKGKKSTKV